MSLAGTEPGGFTGSSADPAGQIILLSCRKPGKRWGVEQGSRTTRRDGLNSWRVYGLDGEGRQMWLRNGSRTD
jgi:hypothetical protein